MSQTPKRAQAPKGAQTTDPAPSPAAAAPAGPRPFRLTAAAAASALEGLGIAGLGVTMFFTASGNGLLVGLFVLALAAFPLAAARGLWLARRWSRGPALVMQLIALPVAWTMLHSGGPAVAAGAVLAAVALAGLVLLVHPATTDALGIPRRSTP